MPDWTYQTLFQRIFFRWNPALARDFAVGAMGRLARTPMGKDVIQFMGHMQPDSRLQFDANGLTFLTPVGLGAELDPELLGLPAFTQFGFSFIEIGPVSTQANDKAGRIIVRQRQESIELKSPQPKITPDSAVKKIQNSGSIEQLILARIEFSSCDEAQQIVSSLAHHVDGWIVPANGIGEFLKTDGARGENESIHIFVSLAANQSRPDQRQISELNAIVDSGEIAGLVISYPCDDDGGVQLGREKLPAALDLVKQLRQELGDEIIIINSVGIHEPADAIDSLTAGASAVALNSGLVFSGPGLAKRINEAALYCKLAKESTTIPMTPSEKLGRQSWLWSFLMGVAMFLGGLMAIVIASTVVVMPYDEAMTGLTREELSTVNDQLLAFMQHDRVTLSGTMLAIGMLYVSLAYNGIRNGEHWAFLSVAISAFAGFVSFFSFLGFGYFDPFHAFVTVILFQFLLLTIHSEIGPRRLLAPPSLHDDWRWKWSQWGQLLFVVHGAILVVAGIVISIVGMTSVFVQEDLEFMQTTAEQLCGVHPQLVPLVAHDRATFGGMLIACGFATSLPAMWGFRAGQAWLWWTLMSAGVTAYFATICVHWAIGYNSLKHLIPAYSGLGLIAIAGIAAYPHLVADDPDLLLEWNEHLKTTGLLNELAAPNT